MLTGLAVAQEVAASHSTKVPLSIPMNALFEGGLGGALLTADTVPVSLTSATSGSDFGAFDTFAGGSWIEIKGTGLSQTTRTWGGGDFDGVNAPTSIDNVHVTINSVPAFVYYVSPTQVNVQVPDDPSVLSGPVEIRLTNPSGQSSTLVGQKRPEVPGMLAPGSFNVGGKQYLVAVFPDQFYVGPPNLIPGVAFRPAKPGDTVLAFGIGFGSVNPPIPSGTIVTTANSLAKPVTVSFGQTPAALAYQGLAPNFVGLYQFNIVVPDVTDGDYQVNIAQAGQPLQQGPLYLTVKR